MCNPFTKLHNKNKICNLLKNQPFCYFCRHRGKEIRFNFEYLRSYKEGKYKLIINRGR